MKMTIDTNIMFQTFKDWNRDYYSFDGCAALLDFYDEIDPEMEFEPVAICCDCTEYGNGCACSFGDLFSDYGYLLDDDDDQSDDEPRLENLVETLDNYTAVLRVENGNYIVFSF